MEVRRRGPRVVYESQRPGAGYTKILLFFLPLEIAKLIYYVNRKRKYVLSNVNQIISFYYFEKMKLIFRA